MRKLVAALALAGGFLWDLLVSSLLVARIVLGRRVDTRPAILVVPVHLRRDWAVVLYAYCTSLTPGSTCLHISADRRRLYLHILDGRDPEATRARFARIYERRLMELER
ncbi:Na+/H+ antiporter subunit E [Sphingomonas sp. KR1UV-12]|uniref:Na+/H+ antiporter subunit E n=1 Tax=Sphingomonas aurea TaxID=3063994 RepID=A0ABT9EN14_9SPHN|nr:Na+/H+ antiporter subunit E [Sphingomonas sp. KR1UV-12]MDP1028346.1 Na+/H+ antiporter subunit E [Sphingomonas sp. KR1UV-12]